MGCRRARAGDAHPPGARHHHSDGPARAAFSSPSDVSRAIAKSWRWRHAASASSRLLRPLSLFAVIATAATTYVMIVALPAANQAFREITFKLLMARGETKIKPRVFYTGFPNLVIYVREVTPGVGWSDVFVADNSAPGRAQVLLAKRGRLLLDEAKRTVADGVDGRRPAQRQPESGREVSSGDVRGQTRLAIDPDTVFPREGPLKGPTEMTIAELKAEMAEFYKTEHLPAQPDHGVAAEIFDSGRVPRLHARGAGTGGEQPPRRTAGELRARRRRLCSSTGCLLYISEAIAKAALLPYGFAWIAMWVPNVIVALWGIAPDRQKTARTGAGAIPVRLPFVRRQRGRRGRDPPPPPCSHRAGRAWWSSSGFRTSRYRGRVFSTGTC